MSDITTFVDQETGSAAFLSVRAVPDQVALAFSIETDGDIDLVVTHQDARRIAQAILAAIDVP